MKEFIYHNNSKIAFILYGILLFIFCYFSFIMVYPFKVFEVTRLIVFDEPIYRDDVITYTLCYKKYRQIPAIVSRQLINSHIITFADVESNAPVTEEEKCVGGFLDLPPYSHKGNHQMIWTAKYHLHFPFYTREISYRYESKPFNILSKGGE